VPNSHHLQEKKPYLPQLNSSWPYTRTRFIKYLGCTLNNHLYWRQHIHNICNKANRTISFLRRNFNISTKETASSSPTVSMQVLSGTPTRRETYTTSRHGPTTSCTVCQELVPQQLHRHRHACRPAMEVTSRTSQGGQISRAVHSHQQQDRSRQLPTHSFQLHIY